MKATLKFNLDDEFERENHLHALNGVKYKIALDEMDNYLRGRLKYEELPEAIDEALEAAREHLRQLTMDFPQ